MTRGPMLLDSLRVIPQTLLALWLIGCCFAAAHRIAWHAVGAGSSALRWAATATTGIALAIAGFFALLPLGLFRPLPAALAAGVCAATALRFVPGPPPQVLLARERRVLRTALRLERPIHRLLALVLGGPAVLAVARTLAGPPLAWDTATYHGVRAALFVQNAFTFESGPGSWSLYRHFFAAGEVLVAWAMLPFHSDLLAGLVNGVEWVALGVACFALARELGLRSAQAAIAAWASIMLPTLRLQVPSGYVELPMLLCVVTALGLALRAVRTERAPAAFLALVSLGAAASIKFVAGIPLAVTAAALAFWGVTAWRRGNRSPARAVAAGVLAAAALIAPWLVAPLLETGYPLSPIPLELFGITLGEADPALAWNRSHDTTRAYTAQAEWNALRAVFVPPGALATALGPSALVPLLAMPLGVAAAWRRSPTAVGMLVAVVLLSIAFVYLPAMNVNRLYWPRANSRYIALAVIVGTPLALVAGRSFRRWGQLLTSVLFVAAAWYSLAFVGRGWSQWESLVVAALGAAVLVLGSLVRWLGHRSERAGVVAGVLALAVITAGLDALQTAVRYELLASARHHHRFPRYWREAAAQLDEPGVARRIAVTAGPHQDGDNWLSYFFLGRSLQNTLHYVPVSRAGTLAHFGPEGRRAQRADERAWLARLAERDISEVLSLRPRSLEQGWMEARPESFPKLAGGPDWGLFRVDER